MKIISVVGARPNFIKIAPLDKVLRQFPGRVEHLICHTGQHFDEKMSDIFFRELEMPKPTFNLGINSGSHASQTGRIMMEFEKVLLEQKPDLVLVPGDVNSTLACSLTAVKLGIKVGHIESGLRSNDRSMPEEINRVVTDAVSDILFVSEESGTTNLLREGVDNSKIHFVGNIMIDSLVFFMPRIEQSAILETMGLVAKQYLLVTFHRPGNVDSREFLASLIGFLNSLAKERTVVFPVHPRTLNNINSFGLSGMLSENVMMINPVGYIEFLALTRSAALVITDSGGIQEETTFLKVPCLTVRENTERPVTITLGTNELVGKDLDRCLARAAEILKNGHGKSEIPPFWDGHVAERIAEILLNH